MLPQPPPNAPPPPPSEATHRSQRWNKAIWVFGSTSIIITLLIAGILTIPSNRSKCNPVPESTTNLRQIGLALLEFETEFGTTPSAATIPLVNATNPSHGLTLGTHSSNDFFRQLFASDCAQSETMFWTRRNSSSSKKPDNIFTGPEALKPGECSFAYITGQTLSTGAKSPIALYPLVPGTPKFDYKLAKEYLYSKAIILWTDNSVTSHIIDPTGKVLINSKDLFDPTQPFWHGTPPDIKWPN
jgi:hypothetical protein